MQQTRQNRDIRLAEVIATLLLAIDLGLGQPMQSMLRLALLSLGLGEALGLNVTELAQIYYFALLRWVGCTSTASVVAAAFGDELALVDWLAPVDRGKPSAMFGALLRNLGSGQPVLDRARILVGAMAAMPRLMEESAAHCEVAARLRALGW